MTHNLSLSIFSGKKRSYILLGHFLRMATSCAILQVTNDLPTFNTRQMHKDFIEKYSRQNKQLTRESSTAAR